MTTSSSSPQIFLRKRFKTLWIWYCIPFNTLSEWPHSFLWYCFAAAVTWNISFHLAQPSDTALTTTSWRMRYRLRYASSTPALSKIRYAKLWSATLRSQWGCTLQQANSNRIFSLEVRLENNSTRTHPTIENSVCKSSLSVINNGVTFITEMNGVLPIIRRETHFARNKSVCERSDGCCGLHSQLHRLLWAYTDAPRRTRINLDDLRRLVEVICTTLNIRLFLLWLPFLFLIHSLLSQVKKYWKAMNSEVFFRLKTEN